MANANDMGGFAMTASTYACIYVREFPAQALLRLRPELREQPFVVLEGDPPMQFVCSLTARTAALGAAHGMTRVELETLPAIVTLPRSPAEEAIAQAALLECAGTFSPRVEQCGSHKAFICVVDITGTDKLFGSPVQLAKTIYRRVRALNLVPCIAVSGNFEASVCLAKGMATQSPIRVVSAGMESEALASLPLSVLPLRPEQAETFSLWGIRTLGALAALPEKELIARMGQESKGLRQLAKGELPHLFAPIEAVFALEEKLELDSPVELLDSLMFAVGVLLEQLIQRATSRVFALASVTLTLLLEGGSTHTRTVRPALPTNDRQLWIKLLHLDLEMHPPAAPLLSITLSAEPGSTSTVQLGLFSPQLPEPSRLDVTLARIAKAVGEERVGRAVLGDTHRREGFHMERFTVPSGVPSELSHDQPSSAIRQIRPPESIKVKLQQEKPCVFWFREKRYEVTRAYGPWLLSGDWWATSLWGQEQWDIVARSQDGRMLCCCVVRDLMHNVWQMVGLYD